ncbi:MAG: hypothetical protein QOE36_3379 [Gaiellaceae bacterium]|nr:hypothetical protein [Gaiellaceae bacterium]
MDEWPESVERVAAFLRESGTEARLEEFREGTPTAVDAARAAGCEPGQIVKSIVLECGGRGYLALVPGDRRADVGKVASAAGCADAVIASPARVRELTGFEPGAVAPFPLPGIERIFMERTLLARDVVWVGAGSSRHLASIAPPELARLARAEPLDLVSGGS